MIAVTGANGQLGQLIIQNLLKRTTAENIVALVRSPEKAQALITLGVQVRLADYSKPKTLEKAFDGVSRLLFVSGSEVGQRVAQHKAVIEAAKNANLELLAYTSLLKAASSPMQLAMEHKITEQMITDSGIPAVILRNGWYSENLTQSLEVVLQHGAVVGAAGQGKIHSAARADYAEAAAAVITAENQAGKIYELAGDQGFTLAEYAELVSRAANKPIQFNNLTRQDYQNLLVEIGLPEGFAGALADADHYASEGWLADQSGDLSQLIGRATTPISQSINQAL